MKAKGLPSRPRPSVQTVPILPSSQLAPFWLRRLCYMERRFCFVTLLLVTVMLIVYGWTAYTQYKWSQQYRKLVSLKRDERQLTTTSEMLKNQMALQAEKQSTGLVPPNPATVIFLKPAPQRPAATELPATKPTAQTKKSNPIPLGY